MIFTILGGGPQQNFQRNTNGNNNHRRRPKGGNVDIDYVPGDQKSNGKTRKNKNSGEYIDYEEL